MRALRWHAARDVRLEDVDEPPPPGDGFATVAVSFCGICGSDLNEYRAGPQMISPRTHPLTGRQPPLTLGHELSGRVTAVGGESDMAPGARVTADACWRCGRCQACARGDYHLCRYGGSIGLHSDGALAPLVQVPTYTLIPLPDAVDDQAGALTEPLAVGLHALRRAATQPGDDVLVLGFGPIGAAAALCASAIGARATVVELDPERARRADGLGYATLSAGEELPRRVRRALGSGGADVVVESTGAVAVVPDAIECARRGGRIALVGLTGEQAAIEPRRLALFERSLVGCLGYCHDLPRVVRLVSEGRIDPGKLIDQVVPLEAAPGVFADLASSPGGRIKVLVDPRG